MDNELQIVDGLKVKEENGQVMFDAETVAIGVGLTEKKNNVTYVIWKRLNQYLGLSTEVSKIKKGDFITESQMYKLALKTGSEKAEKFQDWVTEDVLPSIRKTGTYQAKPLTATEQLRLASESVVELDDRVTALEHEKVITPTDYDYLQRLISNRVSFLSEIHHLNKKQRGPLFKDLNSQIKQVTGASNRSRIKDKDYEKVVAFIGDWTPSTAALYAAEQTELEVE